MFVIHIKFFSLLPLGILKDTRQFFLSATPICWKKFWLKILRTSNQERYIKLNRKEDDWKFKKSDINFVFQIVIVINYLCLALPFGSKKKPRVVFGKWTPMETKQNLIDPSLQCWKTQTNVWNHERVHRPTVGEHEQKGKELQDAGHLWVSIQKKKNNKLIMKTYKFFPKISHCDNNSILKSLVAAFSSVWLWMSSVVAHLVCAQTRKQTTKIHFWSMWGVFLADSAKPWFFLQSVSMLN